MGTWGTSISSDDTYLDIYSEFFSLYNKGHEVDDITTHLIETNRELLKDEDYQDFNNFWYALANAQWECKRLYPDVFRKVETIINGGNDLKYWDVSDKAKREIALKKFLTKISLEREKAKPRTKTKPPLFKKGDCVIFKLTNGNYGGVVILEAIFDEENERSLNLAASTRINSFEKPTIDDFINSEVLITNFQFDNDKQAFQRIYWLYQFGKKRVKDMTEIIGKIEVVYEYSTSTNYGSSQRLDTWFDQIIKEVPLQYKSEEIKERYKYIKTIKELTQNDTWSYW